MATKATLAAALEAYLGIGSREPGDFGARAALPGTDDGRLVEILGEDAPAMKEELDAVLAFLGDLPDKWKDKSLAELATLSAARAKQLHPEFSAALCEEIGRYYTWNWR